MGTLATRLRKLSLTEVLGSSLVDCHFFWDFVLNSQIKADLHERVPFGIHPKNP